MTSVAAIKTRIFHSGDNLALFICENVPRASIFDGMVLGVTSKIVSLAERRLVSATSIDKNTLVRREADVFLGEVGYGVFLTIKDGLFIPSSGIDESNSESGDFILYPSDPTASARKLWSELREAWGITKLGIVFTDSHTMPLRRGVTGIGLSYWGFRAVRNMVGTRDLFGRELRMTQMNLLDGLSAMAVMAMGEGAECQPLALISGADVEFVDECDPDEVRIPPSEDLYGPLLSAFTKTNES
jgi:F420-0:gamma-glutamyl ligase